MQAEIYLILSFFILILASFYAAQSYTLYFWYRKMFGYSKLFVELKKELNGNLSSTGYFAQGNKVISKYAYKNLPNSLKMKYTQCYNVLSFKTQDSNWEIFLYLVKEGFVYNEILIIRCFPKDVILQHESSVERVRGHISIFSTSRYLSEVLEEKHLISKFEWLIRNDSDTLLILSNNLVFKSFSNPKVMNTQKILNILKVSQAVKKQVYNSPKSFKF